MLKYLIIQLDDTSTSFCHYSNDKRNRNLIPYNVLKEGVFWAMKENLLVQFVYPTFELPEEYVSLIDTIEHIDIVSSNKSADVVVCDSIEELEKLSMEQTGSIIVRITLTDFLAGIDRLGKYGAINIVITDVENVNANSLDEYRKALEKLAVTIHDGYLRGKKAAVNIVTDRIHLLEMNNCNAGVESVTLAPDGKFYLCPGFYLDGEEPIGSLQNGIKIKNQNLLTLAYAPICRTCDAYQCKRCIWLNKKLTHEINTPSKQQCVMAHHERNVSRLFLEKLKGISKAFYEFDIPKIDYIDPFENIKR
ncbi:CXXX repeat peptide maturase [Phocaeicola coprocola]|uniref:CXXX repeat peptide maturase n=1 Tax=Phocaeicola coprocola TaxID=310298 RepID=UPI0032C14BBF